MNMQGFWTEKDCKFKVLVLDCFLVYLLYREHGIEN